MQKNWYIIYTKPKYEKKVSAILEKRKIENFSPLHRREITLFRKRKTLLEPLFQSYVFAHVEEAEIDKIKGIEGVVNLLYWKGIPAVIKEEEIKIIKEFINDYPEIHVEKTKVSETGKARVIDGSIYSISGNLLSIKNSMIRVNLPSIGFSLVAELASTYSSQTPVTFGEKSLLMQS